MHKICKYLFPLCLISICFVFKYRKKEAKNTDYLWKIFYFFSLSQFLCFVNVDDGNCGKSLGSGLLERVDWLTVNTAYFRINSVF